MEEKSKGNVPTILTKFLRKKLKSLLSGYLKKFDLNKVGAFDQINIGLSNFIEFLNVELKEDVLLKFQVPLVITEGRIGKLSIKINMPSNNSEIKVENVLIRVTSLRESRTNYSREEADGMSQEVSSNHSD
jgi:hypothetical protein